MNTWLNRRWPPPGVLSTAHADSQRNTLVQLADMVAGSVNAQHKSGDRTMQLITEKFGATAGGKTGDSSKVTGWMRAERATGKRGKQKTEPPGGHAPSCEGWGEQINRLPAVPGLTFRFCLEV